MLGVRGPRVWQQDQELLPAPSKEEVMFTHHPANAVGQEPQHPVSHLVAELVVHDFEAIDIEEHDGDALAETTTALDLPLKEIRKGPAIEAAREHVPQRMSALPLTDARQRRAEHRRREQRHGE